MPLGEDNSDNFSINNQIWPTIKFFSPYFFTFTVITLALQNWFLSLESVVSKHLWVFHQICYHLCATNVFCKSTDLIQRALTLLVWKILFTFIEKKMHINRIKEGRWQHFSKFNQMWWLNNSEEIDKDAKPHEWFLHGGSVCYADNAHHTKS